MAISPGTRPLAFFQLVDQYPRSLECKTAYSEIMSLGDELMRNAVSAAEVQSFVQQIPTWAQRQSVESKYILFALQYGQAVAARKRGDGAAKLQLRGSKI